MWGEEQWISFFCGHNHLFITAYAGYAAIEKLKGNELSEEKRIQRYRFSFLWNVVSGGVVMLLIVMGPATLEETGFRPIRFLQGSHRYLVFGTWILCGLLSAVFSRFQGCPFTRCRFRGRK